MTTKERLGKIVATTLLTFFIGGICMAEDIDDNKKLYFGSPDMPDIYFGNPEHTQSEANGLVTNPITLTHGENEWVCIGAGCEFKVRYNPHKERLEVFWNYES